MTLSTELVDAIWKIARVVLRFVGPYSFGARFAYGMQESSEREKEGRIALVDPHRGVNHPVY